MDGGGDRCNDPSARILVRFVEDPAEGSKALQIADPLVLRQPAGNIDRLDVELVPAALFADAVNPARVRESLIEEQAHRTSRRR